jgi:hypothetical protein
MSRHHHVLMIMIIGLVAVFGSAACSSEKDGSGAAASGNAPDPTPHCLDATEGAAYGCARAADQDGSCSYWATESGWGEAYACPCLDGDCAVNGTPCDGANSSCPECLGSSLNELGLGCVGNGSNGGSATFCCGADHGQACVRERSGDLGGEGSVFCDPSRGYPVDGKPYFYLCLDDAHGGPPDGWADICVSVLGTVDADGWCCPSP